jgi:hypothetical protein
MNILFIITSLIYNRIFYGQHESSSLTTEIFVASPCALLERFDGARYFFLPGTKSFFYIFFYFLFVRYLRKSYIFVEILLHYFLCYHFYIILYFASSNGYSAFFCTYTKTFKNIFYEFYKNVCKFFFCVDMRLAQPYF